MNHLTNRTIRNVAVAVVILVSALSSAAGYVLLDPTSGSIGPSGQAVAEAFAAGALLTMLTDKMLPEAYEEERDFTGALGVRGFAGARALAALDNVGPGANPLRKLCDYLTVRTK